MSNDIEKCKSCFGTGNEARMRAMQPGEKILFRPCPECKGTGKVPAAMADQGGSDVGHSGGS